jgi:hypothetical protein
MSKRDKMTGTRTPVINVRDPEPQTRDPEPAPAREQHERQSPPVVRVQIPRCSACGHGVFRTGGTSDPNRSTREMWQHRTCAHCGKTHWFAYPMNEAQLAKYGLL